jgi:hypothetical protein
VDKQYYKNKVEEKGFTISSFSFSNANGYSAYIGCAVKVLDDLKMPDSIFVFDGVANLTIRISDHLSNLETLCAGVAGNRVSEAMFNKLVENRVIAPYARPEIQIDTEDGSAWRWNEETGGFIKIN